MRVDPRHKAVVIGGGSAALSVGGDEKTEADDERAEGSDATSPGSALEKEAVR